ncbi:hypothetical protein [Bradyrhizobium sp. 930_D9_N1_4]|uniref:hypothetical protein n=1 Tax=Bradyrhizobium sp. 930_D9_N1_4 TaxID=3240374 RepID=UPI003F8B9F19
MSDKTKPSAQWEGDAVARRLRQATKPGRPSAVQVFLNDEISASDLPEKAKQIVTDMSASLNLPADAIKLGKVFRSAKSFSVSTDIPDVFDALAKCGDVKSILESEQPDILPKPTNVKDA